MRKTIIALAGALALAGCAADSGRLDQIESRLAEVSRTADQALSMAQAAQDSAQSVSGDASAAAANAQRALDVANDAAERAKRIGETCCTMK